MLIPMIENVEINTCPNSSDSRDDCKECSFACGWHQVGMRCVPREGIDVASDYSNLKFDLMYLPKARKARRGIAKANAIRKMKKVEEEAIWV